jgi:hypothetical protein
MYGTQIPGFVSPVYFATPATLAGYWSLIVKIAHNVGESLGWPMLAARGNSQFCQKGRAQGLI